MERKKEIEKEIRKMDWVGKVNVVLKNKWSNKINCKNYMNKVLVKKYEQSHTRCIKDQTDYHYGSVTFILSW